MARGKERTRVLKAHILNATALREVKPGGLAAYERSAGWTKAKPSGDAADVSTGESRPESALPRPDLFGDNASVASRLVGIFADAAKTPGRVRSRY